jgi:cytochrome c biogenesis protein ResB
MDFGKNGKRRRHVSDDQFLLQSPSTAAMKNQPPKYPIAMNYNDPIQTPTAATEPVTEAANKAWSATQEKAREAVQSGERYVRENPGTSALTIFGFGVMVGLLVGYSLAHEERDDYSASTRKLLKRWSHKLNLE